MNVLRIRNRVRKNSPAHSVLLDWRKTILVASQFFAFLHSLGRYCSLIPGLGVKLSTIILAWLTVLSAVGACPPHDGVRRRWWINVESAVTLSGARQASNDLTTATVPAGTTFPAVSREPCDLLMRATRRPSSSTS